MDLDFNKDFVYNYCIFQKMRTLRKQIIRNVVRIRRTGVVRMENSVRTFD